MLKQCPEVEVHFRDKVVFPFASVADANIERPLQRHAVGDDPEAQPKPVAKPSDGTPTIDSPGLPDIPADFYITKARIQKWGPTDGCPGCSRPGTEAKHILTCKARFYEKLIESGYEVCTPAPSSGAQEYEIVRRTRAELDEEQMLD